MEYEVEEIEDKNLLESVDVKPRGVAKKKRAKVFDRQGNEWFVNATKEAFMLYPKDRSVEVFNKSGEITKKFIKSFLKIEM